MDRHPILDHSSASPAAEGDMLCTSASRIAAASVSAGIAAASASSETGPRFPGEDGGQSLAEMAQSDLDAALQLLADRAQYITGSSGAAIALRRSEHADMLCRASAGSNAPELGALLSTEYGLSGESVRTRQPLCCNDAESDPRVNRESCRQLGIASVLVVPIVSEGLVLGVFELFSGGPHAFDERDLSALQRLSEMVETAVKHAVAAQPIPAVEETPCAETEPSTDGRTVEVARIESAANTTGPEFAPAPAAQVLSPPEPEKTEREETMPAPSPNKPLFWSAAVQTPASARGADEATQSISVPPVLRNLHRCQVCGFPVSQGRTFCVECEEKQWRGLPLPQTEASDVSTQAPVQTRESQTVEPGRGELAVPHVAVVVSSPPELLTSAPIEKAAVAARTSATSSSDLPDFPAHTPTPGDSPPFLISAVTSESWFAANKYILGALLLVAIVIGVMAWLR